MQPVKKHHQDNAMQRGSKGQNHPEEGRKLDTETGEVGESSSVAKINKYNVDSGSPDVP